MHHRRFVNVGLVSVLSLLLSACAGDQKEPATAEEVRDGEGLPAAPPVPAEPASTSSPTAPTVPDSQVPQAATPDPAKDPLTEAQIARVGELINTSEVEQGKLAQAKAKAADVKKLAAMMVKHHGDALKEQAKLVKKLGLKSEESTSSAQLKADAEKTLEKLKSTDTAGFDAAYVASQVEGHQKVLDLIDKQLLPSAKTPEVTDALRRGRSFIEQHLAEARALQTK